MPAKSAATSRDVEAELAFLTRALKAPSTTSSTEMAPKSTSDCAAWNRTVGCCRSSSRNSPPVTHQTL